MSETITLLDGKTISIAEIKQANEQQLAIIDQYAQEKVGTTGRNLIFAGSVVAGGALFVGFGAQILTGTAAVIAVAATGALGYGAWKLIDKFDPIVRQKARNLQVKLMKDEARKNAIEQLENQVFLRHQKLEACQRARDTLGTQIKNLRKKIDPKNKGTEMYNQKVSAVVRFEEVYEIIKDNVDKLAQSNVQFKEKVNHYRSMDDFNRAAEVIQDGLKAFGGDDMQDLLSLTAFDAIDDNFNAALTAIENSTRDMKLRLED